jgi:Ca2+-binding EF-hand superfamily protein
VAVVKISHSSIEYENFKQKFFTLFDSVSSFSVNQQEEYKKQLIKKLSKYIEQLNESIKSFDQNNTGFITFQQLRKILDSININLDDELVEYLIYLMKCFTNDENTNLEDLRYSVVFCLIIEYCELDT